MKRSRLLVVAFATLIAFAGLSGPATAFTGGTVTGRVTDQVTGDPISGLVVQAVNALYVRQAVTGSDGSYTMGQVPAGTYQVCGYPSDSRGLPNPRPNGTGWLMGCADDQATVRVGHTVTADFSLPPGGAFTGTVTDQKSHAPIAHVLVYVYTSAGYLTTVISNNNGGYHVFDLPTGTYFACFYAGNTGASDLDACYRGVPYSDRADATPINVVAGQLTQHIFAALPTAGTIAGTVTRAGDGAPMQYVQVRVFDPAGEIAGFAATDPDGRYRIIRLQPGTDYTVCFDISRYLAAIRAQGNPGGLVPACWPDVPWDETTIPPGAQPVRAVAGVTTADAALQPAGAITVTARSTATNDPLDADYSLIGSMTGTDARFRSRNNRYTLYDLVPGSTYLACADGAFALDSGNGQFGFTSACYRNAPWVPGTAVPPDATPVTATAGRVTTATVRLAPAGRVSGRAHGAGGVVMPVQVGIYDADGVLVGDSTTYRGSYTVWGVPVAADDVVCFSADGYQSQCYQHRAWDGDPADLPSGTTPVSVSAGVETTGINATLQPIG